MRIAIKYGLPITLVVILWIIVTHFVFPLAPGSKANALAPVLFNLAAIVAIYQGIKERRSEGEITFKEGLKTGVSISFVYGVSACLFFFVVFLILGQTLMANEPMAESRPLWQVALLAFAGMFLGPLILGLIYSTIISAFLAKRLRS